LGYVACGLVFIVYYIDARRLRSALLASCDPVCWSLVHLPFTLYSVAGSDYLLCIAVYIKRCACMFSPLGVRGVTYVRYWCLRSSEYFIVMWCALHLIAWTDEWSRCQYNAIC